MLLATAAGAAIIVPVAPTSAAVVATKITSPTAGAVIDAANPFGPSRVTVAGVATVDGHDAADQVRLIVQVGTTVGSPLGGSPSRATGPIDVQPDGSFSTEISVPHYNAILRAVPAGAPQPAESDPAFPGNLVLGGSFNDLSVPVPEDEGWSPRPRFTAIRGQRDGFFILEPTGSLTPGGSTGGLAGGPSGENGAQPSLVFLGSGALGARYNDSRGAIMVDGVRGYLRDQIENAEPARLPLPTVTRTVDPATGGQRLVQRQLLYVAADQADDPEAVEHGYVPSGVELERTVVQDRDGARATVTDVFRSTDGRAHRTDLLYSEGFVLPTDERVRGRTGDDETDPFADPPEVAGTPPAFRIPWETGSAWRTKSQADPLSAPPATVSSVFLRIPDRFSAGRDYATDPGDVFGAITFGTRPDGGLFLVQPSSGEDHLFDSSSQFVARFVREIPATGSTTITQTYSQATTSERVEQLAAESESALTPVPPAVPPTVTAPIVTTPLPVPVQRVRPRRLTLSATPKRDTSGPRKLRFSGRLVLPAKTSAAVCTTGGTVSVQVRSGRHTLSSRRVRLDKACRYVVRVTFASAKRFGRSTRLTAQAHWAGNRGTTAVSAKRTTVRVR